MLGASPFLALTELLLKHTQLLGDKKHMLNTL